MQTNSFIKKEKGQHIPKTRMKETLNVMELNLPGFNLQRTPTQQGQQHPLHR